MTREELRSNLTFTEASKMLSEEKSTLLNSYFDVDIRKGLQ